MNNPLNNNHRVSKPKARGRVKISEAVRKLLREKSYQEITWGEIARTAGVSEALIYRHFNDRQGLLCSVIEEMLEDYLTSLGKDLQGTHGALNKLRRIIWNHFDRYNRDRVFARTLLLETRSFPLFFSSGAYRLIRTYGDMILDIIKEGVYYGEIRDDTPPELIRQIVLGTIEHLCLPYVIFGREFSPEFLTETACRIVFSGIEPLDAAASPGEEGHAVKK